MTRLLALALNAPNHSVLQKDGVIGGLDHLPVMRREDE